ncbi:MAG: right-handed parallel beta-helix repeat-containing protein [Gammaproteobacteria bacterium]|nr:right-handed parallel beta-helix repeat-containing protein [Gammaproteobacteria bacterium]
MYKNLSVLSLLAPLLLAGCGAANLGDPSQDANGDVTPPQLTAIIINAQPAVGGNKTLDGVNLDHVTFVFDEAIDIAQLKDSNNVLVGGTNTVSINGTPTTLVGNWEYDDTSFMLTFKPTNSLLGNNAMGAVMLSKKVADLAGNLYNDGSQNLVDRALFATLKTLEVTVSVNGLLPAGANVTVTNKTLSNLADTLTFTAAANSATFTNVPVINGQTYIVEVKNTQQVCTGTGTFIMGLTAPSIVVNCSDVTPYFANAPYWNDRLQPKADPNTPGPLPLCDNTVNSGCFHGGIYRVYETSNLTSCAGVSITDALSAFTWICQTKADGSGIQAISTGFAAGKGLRDLLNVQVANPIENSSAAWRSNKITLKQNNQTYSSALSVWWPNTINLTSSSLLSAGRHVYVYVDMGISRFSTPAVDNNNIGSISNISLVIPAGTKLVGNVNLLTPHLWVEGEFIGASNNEAALTLGSTNYAILHNIRIPFSNGSGILLDNATNTRSGGTININNANGHGLQITDGKFNALSNVVLTNNLQNGLFITKTDQLFDAQVDNMLENVRADNNGGNGIELRDTKNNHIILSTASSNGGDGLRFSKSNAAAFGASFNYVSQFTSVNNAGAGIRATDNLLLNTINGSFITLNSGGGVVATTAFAYSPLRFNRSEIAHNGTGNCIIDSGSVCPAGLAVVNPASMADVFVGSTGLSEQYGNINFGINDGKRWVGGTFDLNADLGGGECTTQSEPCVLVDWSLKANSSFPSQNSNNTLAKYVAGFDDNNVNPVEFNYQPAKVDHLYDGLGNSNGYCSVGEVCTDALTIGHYQRP